MGRRRRVVRRLVDLTAEPEWLAPAPHAVAALIVLVAALAAIALALSPLVAALYIAGRL